MFSVAGYSASTLRLVESFLNLPHPSSPFALFYNENKSS